MELEKLLKIINKKYILKTNYKKESEIYENENNVDNYVKNDKKNSYINFFNNYNKKINNELEDENEINKIRRIKSFSDVYNKIFSIKNGYSKKNIKSSENQDINNEVIKENQNIKIIGRFSLPKFNFNNIFNKDYHINNRKRKSIIEGYLSNSNIKSAKYFNAILIDKDKFQFYSTNESNPNKRGSKQLMIEYANELNRQRIFRNTSHNNDLNLNHISNNDTKNDGSVIEKEKVLSKKHKLYENNLSDMNIIYEENEQENKKYNFKNTYPYFSPNNKRRQNLKSKKNKDISKFLDSFVHRNQEKDKDNEIKKEKKINKYDYINTNRTQRKNIFNKPKNMKKYSTHFRLKKNNYNLTRNIHTYSLKKSNTNPKSSYIKPDKSVTEKNDINEKSEEVEEELENKKVPEKPDSAHDKNNIQNEIKKNALNKDISIKELSVLDNNQIEKKEKFKIIKEFKDKAIFNIFCIVNKILKEKQHLQMNIENLTKFTLEDSYKKYVNILKQLIEKERSISGLSKPEKVKDAEIIKYIHRIFSDEYSSFYIKPKKDNLDYSKTITSNLSNFLKDYDSNSNLLSHKRYLSINSMKKNTRKTKRDSTKKISVDVNNIIIKKPFQKKKSIENQKTIKQFLEGKIEDEEIQKKDFLKQKMNLTKELRYQIEITHDEEGKIRFQTLLEQIEALKNDDILEYLKFIHEKYENFKKEIKRLVNVREKEERINYFLNELIYERENINKVKQITGRYVSFEDYKF